VQLIEQLVIGVAIEFDWSREQHSQSVHRGARIRRAVAVDASQEDGLKPLCRAVAKSSAAGQEGSLNLCVLELEATPFRISIRPGASHRAMLIDVQDESVSQFSDAVHTGIVSDVLPDGGLAANILVLLPADTVRVFYHVLVLGESCGDLLCPGLAEEWVGVNC